ncbi:hypothetical protein [Intestinibacter sp.]
MLLQFPLCHILGFFLKMYIEITSVLPKFAAICLATDKLFPDPE